MKSPIKEKNSFNIVLRIIEFIKPFKALLILQILLNTCFSTLSTISITLIKPILDILFSNNINIQHNSSQANILENLSNKFFILIYNLIQSDDTYQTLLNVSYLIISVFILKNIFKYFASITSTKLEESVIKNIRDTIFTKITGLSLEFFTRSKLGNLISILTNDVTAVNSSTLSSFTTFIRESIQIILFLFLLLSISTKLTLIAFSTSVISLFLIRYAVQYLRKYAARMQTAMADYTTTLSEMISGIRVVKAYNAEKTINNKFISDTNKYVRSAIKHRKVIELVPAFNEVFAIFALCVVLFIGGNEVLSGYMEPEKLMLFLFSLFSIMSPIATVVNAVSGFQRGIVSAERIFTILDETTKVISGDKQINNFEKSIEINNVNFAYIDKDVIKDNNFKIEKNKKIAFVGSSGSGKSTMLDLIIRFYDPTNGEILIDGNNIRQFDIQSYRNLFGIVSQENMLFNDTILNNIRYGFEEASEYDIIEASKKANAYNFIQKLPDSFNTIIGDRGVTLSGGERQRIAIARALVRNPQILVFDEATSALDAESEKVVQKAINESLKNKTAIIVAHRLSTIIDCDEILVFDDGKISERGTHSELIQKKGIYYKLYEIQFTEKI